MRRNKEVLSLGGLRERSGLFLRTFLARRSPGYYDLFLMRQWKLHPVRRRFGLLGEAGIRHVGALS